MTKKNGKIILTILVFFCYTTIYAQEPGRMPVIDPAEHKIIPDKVMEFGAPLLLIFAVINSILTIFRVRSDAKLKEKALDKGISEATLIELFREDRNMMKLLYLRWFLILAAIGIALIYIHFLDQYVHLSSGYLALGIIALLVSFAFLIYYRIIRKF